MNVLGYIGVLIVALGVAGGWGFIAKELSDWLARETDTD